MANFLNLFIERVLLWVALGLVLFGTYLHFVSAPYLGFAVLFSGRVMLISPASEINGPQLKTEDLLLTINGLNFAEFNADRRQPTPILSSARAGDQLNLTVLRDGAETVQIVWTVPGVTPKELVFRLGKYWWIGFVYWGAALATVLLVRPKDVKWRLLTAFFLITAVWLSIGNGPLIYPFTFGIFASAVWLTIPIYLHLHWTFPHPLNSNSGWIVLLYILGILLVILEVFTLIPAHAYYIGGLLSIGGTCVLVIVRYIVRSQDRSSVRIMLGGISVSFLPLLFPIVARLLNVDNSVFLLATFGLPILPLAYFYAAYRHQLGAMELRANRVIALYLYFLVTLMVVPLSILAINQAITDTTMRSLTITAIAVVAVLVSIAIFPRFQRLVETYLLGMPVPPERLLHTYTERISATTDFRGVVQLIRQEVLPSLLIRQSLLCRWDGDSLTLIDKDHPDADQLDDGQLPGSEDVPILLAHAERYLPVQESPLAVNAPHLSWVRLILPLRFDGKVTGLWLLGQRDPDDFYSYQEVELLASVARQTGVAVSNIIQMEQLRLVYQANVERHELERKKLALMLHDEVLNRQAQILWDLPPEAITPEIDDIYHSLTEQVRQIILELRPPLLEYGLHMALEQLIDGALKHNPTADLIFDIEEAEHRYPLKVEEHVFRIVQQALENALLHADGAAIHVTGCLEPGHIKLQLCDSGEGFDMIQIDSARLLMERRFGLVGMQERATLIGADLQIRSTPGAGTCVSLTWNAEDFVDDSSLP